MKNIIWDETLSVEVDEIDADHRKLELKGTDLFKKLNLNLK